MASVSKDSQEHRPRFGPSFETPTFGRLLRMRISDRVQPPEMDRIALTTEQRHRLIERQADHVRVGADHLHDERSGEALHGISAGLAAPFARSEIGLEILARE